jgi:hypothetical protein
MSEVYQVTHLVPVSTFTISLSRFESTAIGNGVDVSDGSENLPSKDLAALSVGILLDGLSFDIMMVKKRAALLLPTPTQAKSICVWFEFCPTRSPFYLMMGSDPKVIPEDKCTQSRRMYFPPHSTESAELLNICFVYAWFSVTIITGSWISLMATI